MTTVKNTLFFILGQTATGKKEIVRFVASQANAEIISVDSMKIYRGLDIGTAKPTVEDRKKYRYHFIDFLSPGEPYSVANFVKECDRVIDDISKRKKQPLLVVGTPLYFKRLLYGIFESPQSDGLIRKKLESLADEKGGSFLYAELQKTDPDRAAQLHPNDRRRIIRALEVQALTGHQMSQLQTHDFQPQPRYRSILVGLRREKKDLTERINQRVERMFESGLVEEVTRIQSGELSKQVTQSVGYKEIIEYLQGKLTLPEAKELVKRNTRRLAKRQMTWFRSFKDIVWIDIKPDELTENIARKVTDIFIADRTKTC